MPVQKSSRPDPDELLAQLQDEELQKKSGNLKIFLGYAAGVGKTYAMLEAAHQRKEEGVEVVVGYVVWKLSREGKWITAESRCRKWISMLS
jgi:K+-sensing histidine kinase KdpD